MPESLQDIASAWANWVVQEKPEAGGVSWTETTDYASQPALANHMGQQITATYLQTNYDLNYPPPTAGPPLNSVVTSYSNASSAQNTYDYSGQASATQQVTISVTEAVNVGVTVTASITLPDLVTAGETDTAGVNLSSTQSYQASVTHTYTYSHKVPVPPWTEIFCQLVVSMVNYTDTWTSIVRLQGSVAVCFENAVALTGSTAHHGWLVPVQDVFSQCQTYTITDTTGYAFGPNGVQAQCSGTISGGTGTAVNVKVTEQALPHPGGATPAAAGNSYEIPLSLGGGPAATPVDVQPVPAA